MRSTFVILGYGVPKNIHRDGNYQRYLLLAFNIIFEASKKHSLERIDVTFSGGHTDMYKPYRRTEANEMVKFFRVLLERLSQRQRRRWHLYTESTSLSTLENLVFVENMMKRKGMANRNATIFCEYTRQQRIRALIKKIFGSRRLVRVVPIDFDGSANRYVDPDFLKAKEAKVLKFDLWALKNSKNFTKWHNLFVEKIAFLRSVPPKHQVKAIEQWWRMQFRTLKVPK